ncbi:MAG: hypothetical protein U1F06_03150 [Steroidobacteraceae bacterium]
MGVLRFQGRDAAAFLHGQLSNDVLALADGAQQLAGYHTNQGRADAPSLARLGREELLAQLPLELADAVAQRLRRYVLRAKLTIEVLDAAAAAVAAASIPGWSPARARGDDIAAGLPQVYAATSEKFVAQMLNLDCVGAVSFSKGCYTGQEVIARAHYRGRVKRRMQRFATRAPLAAPLRPGDVLRLADARRPRSSMTSRSPTDARSSGHRPAARRRRGIAGHAAGRRCCPGHDRRCSAPAPVIDCEALPLPYALPD